MSKILTITGKDSLTLNLLGRPVIIDTNLSFGEASKIEFPNELATVKTGKDGNTIMGLNNSGLNAKLTLRVPISCDADKALNSVISAWSTSPTTFLTISGVFIKKTGDGNSNESNTTYTLAGGVPVKVPGVTYNSEGDAEQGVVTWEMLFAFAGRTIA